MGLVGVNRLASYSGGQCGYTYDAVHWATLHVHASRKAAAARAARARTFDMRSFLVNPNCRVDCRAQGNDV
jgi:hypothetical protein